jgi:hypothetical protein
MELVRRMEGRMFRETYKRTYRKEIPWLKLPIPSAWLLVLLIQSYRK